MSKRKINVAMMMSASEKVDEETSYRLGLTIREKIALIGAIEEEMKCEYIADETKIVLTNIIKKINNLKFIYLENKRTATKNANEAKKKKSLEKITNALNLLRLENKKPTVNLIAKTAGMSYNTVKKYQAEIAEYLK